MRITILILLLATNVSLAWAQTPSESNDSSSEDLEPRIVGKSGTTTIGIGGYLDRFFSSEDSLPMNYVAQADVLRFMTDRIALSGGVVGAGSVGGESDGSASGPGALALHLFGGALWYFTPASMGSFYAGGEYWAQVTNRAERDAGSLLAKAGFQAAVSSRASLFIEGGYGFALTKGSEDEVLSRVQARIGVRLRIRE
jgi:hypothetical protein